MTEEYVFDHETERLRKLFVDAMENPRTLEPARDLASAVSRQMFARFRELTIAGKPGEAWKYLEFRERYEKIILKLNESIDYQNTQGRKS